MKGWMIDRIQCQEYTKRRVLSPFNITGRPKKKARIATRLSVSSVSGLARQALFQLGLDGLQFFRQMVSQLVE